MRTAGGRRSEDFGSVLFPFLGLTRPRGLGALPAARLRFLAQGNPDVRSPGNPDVRESPGRPGARNQTWECASPIPG